MVSLVILFLALKLFSFVESFHFMVCPVILASIAFNLFSFTVILASGLHFFLSLKISLHDLLGTVRSFLDGSFVSFPLRVPFCGLPKATSRLSLCLLHLTSHLFACTMTEGLGSICSYF